MSRVAIIGSTGLSADDFIDEPRQIEVPTRAGSVVLHEGRRGSHDIVFLSRSNGRKGVAPHMVNYRANILSLIELGVRHIFATSVVGSLTSTIPAGAFVILDQFLDFTKQRPITLFDESGFAFVDVTDPYCPELRALLLRGAAAAGIPARPTGCYVTVEGPRYETRAEIEMYRGLGGDVIGMTNVPEVVMAREAGICYAALAFVSNMGAGLNASPITRAENFDATIAHAPRTKALLHETLDLFTIEGACYCAAAPADFLTAD